MEAASGLEERLRDAVAREQLRGERIPEVDRELAAHAEAQATSMLRNTPIGPTPMEREEHCRIHEPYRAWCHVCIAGRGRADLHAMRDESESGLLVFGVDHGCLRSRSAKNAGDVVEADNDGGDRQDELASLVWTKLTRWVFSPARFKARATAKEVSQSSVKR